MLPIRPMQKLMKMTIIPPKIDRQGVWYIVAPNEKGELVVTNAIINENPQQLKDLPLEKLREFQKVAMREFTVYTDKDEIVRVINQFKKDIRSK